MRLFFFMAVALWIATGCTSEVVSTDNCGDGIVDIDEECDGEDFAGEDCTNFGYYGGVLNCTSKCTIEKSSCVAAGQCGDGIIQGQYGEECDGTNFGNISCLDQGYSSGELSCDGSCKLIIDNCTSECTADQIFFNSPNPNCSPMSKCAPDASSIVEEELIMQCLPEDEFAQVPFYGPCDITTEYGCPHGAICTPIIGKRLCMPICHGTYNPVCPSNGVCIVNKEVDDGNGAGVCFRPDVCDPIMDTGCDIPTTGKHCYLLDNQGDALCASFADPITHISLDALLPDHGEPCQALSEGYKGCKAGNVCLSFLGGPQDTCARLCHPGIDSECDTGEHCISVGVGWLGACF
ncbi:hypothetical protein KKF84_01740 [Myxococcota bacterium]|nr:hypothetical protein [Myxococcota bacterium]MBU1534008.1 hypothetical protein [Myxococcota bacterium]